MSPLHSLCIWFIQSDLLYCCSQPICVHSNHCAMLKKPYATHTHFQHTVDNSYIIFHWMWSCHITQCTCMKSCSVLIDWNFLLDSISFEREWSSFLHLTWCEGLTPWTFLYISAILPFCFYNLQSKGTLARYLKVGCVEGKNMLACNAMLITWPCARVCLL